ncbi:MAG: hypothetical protein LIO96_09040 [Lachnospiraceae bacterium]|nr:hypothetical protein [Lachnospiraceae bacterium]
MKLKNKLLKKLLAGGMALSLAIAMLPASAMAAEADTLEDDEAYSFYLYHGEDQSLLRSEEACLSGQIEYYVQDADHPDGSWTVIDGTVTIIENDGVISELGERNEDGDYTVTALKTGTATINFTYEALEGTDASQYNGSITYTVTVVEKTYSYKVTADNYAYFMVPNQTRTLTETMTCYYYNEEKGAIDSYIVDPAEYTRDIDIYRMDTKKAVDAFDVAVNEDGSITLTAREDYGVINLMLMMTITAYVDGVVVGVDTSLGYGIRNSYYSVRGGEGEYTTIEPGGSMSVSPALLYYDKDYPNVKEIETDFTLSVGNVYDGNYTEISGDDVLTYDTDSMTVTAKDKASDVTYPVTARMNLIYNNGTDSTGFNVIICDHEWVADYTEGDEIHYYCTKCDEEKTEKTGDVLNGVCQASDGNWYYYVDGVVQSGYSGFQSNSNGKWYIDGGQVTFKKNGVFQDTEGSIGAKGTWYYVTGSKVRTDYTGVADYANSNGWWYIKNGKVDFSFNGIASNANGSWVIKNGKVNFGYNGTYKYKGKTYKVSGGKVKA